MIVTFPNSSAMDATVPAGGPGTVLPLILTGSPEQIARHAGELREKATEFTDLMTEFGKAAEQLEKVWSGAAAEAALRQLADSLAALTKIIEVVRNEAELLAVSGILVKTAQEAYRAVVSTVNPTVAVLMSSPWTHDAAVALAAAASASLRAFIRAIGALLETVGAVDLAGQADQLMTIIDEIEKLSGRVHGRIPVEPVPVAEGAAGAGATVALNLRGKELIDVLPTAGAGGIQRQPPTRN